MTPKGCRAITWMEPGSLNDLLEQNPACPDYYRGESSARQLVFTVLHPLPGFLQGSIFGKGILIVSLLSKNQPYDIIRRKAKASKCCVTRKCGVKVKVSFPKYNGLVQVHLDHVFGSKKNVVRGPLRNVGVYKGKFPRVVRAS